MADKNAIHLENVPGKYYVDLTCTPCNDCIHEAANLIKYSEDESHVYVYKQPSTEDEVNAMRNAMSVCPIEAIGDDGDT